LLVKETWKTNIKRAAVLCMTVVICCGCTQTTQQEDVNEEGKESVGRSEILIDGKYSVDPTKIRRTKQHIAVRPENSIISLMIF